jgi:hypothetical protein
MSTCRLVLRCLVSRNFSHEAFSPFPAAHLFQPPFATLLVDGLLPLTGRTSGNASADGVGLFLADKGLEES